MENDAAGFAMQEHTERFERLANRRSNGTAPRAVAVHQLFQTPADLSAQLIGKLSLSAGTSLLEPSAGLGRLIRAALPFALSKLTAIEIAPQCASELFREFDFEGMTLLQRDFLTVTPEETGLFDAVAMNPPFTMRSDIAHIKHALQFLAPSGRLAALCMNTRHRETALRGLCDSWEPIPAGAFRKEGTGIPSVLLTITKRAR